MILQNETRPDSYVCDHTATSVADRKTESVSPHLLLLHGRKHESHWSNMVVFRDVMPFISAVTLLKILRFSTLSCLLYLAVREIRGILVLVDQLAIPICNISIGNTNTKNKKVLQYCTNTVKSIGNTANRNIILQY